MRKINPKIPVVGQRVEWDYFDNDGKIAKRKGVIKMIIIDSGIIVIDLDEDHSTISALTTRQFTMWQVNRRLRVKQKRNK